jgi:predicted transposase/invertase (TIGR01784 family)
MINMFLENMKVCDEIAYQKGKLEGKLEGKFEGISEGERKGKLETVKAMLVEGLSVAFIAKVTGISVMEIEQLRH